MSEDNTFILKEMVRDYCGRYFDRMPEPPITIEKGVAFDSENILAHYRPDYKDIQVSEKAAGDYVCLMELKDTVKHELVHAWVHWKGYNSHEHEGHNIYFFWKAHQLGLDLEGVFEKYPGSRKLYKKVLGGWEPQVTDSPQDSDSYHGYPPFEFIVDWLEMTWDDVHALMQKMADENAYLRRMELGSDEPMITLSGDDYDVIRYCEKWPEGFGWPFLPGKYTNWHFMLKMEFLTDKAREYEYLERPSGRTEEHKQLLREVMREEGMRPWKELY
jgi:hypothetical protein